jgi:N-formylmaleamate deformylase
MQTSWQERDIIINGRKVHYIRTGKGKKQPLLLIHGRSDNGLCWAKTAKKLENQYDVIMPDSRGHGLSARIQPGEEIDNAGDLAEFIKYLGVEKPIIAGHSMGAASSSELGARYPELPKALVLEDPPWRERPSERISSEKQVARPVFQQAETYRGKTLEEVIAQYQPQYPTWDPEVLRLWCLGKTQMDQNFVRVKRLFRMGWRDIISKITCPTLLITADPPGGIVTTEIAEQAVEMNSNITHVHIAGTGHHIRFENYQDFFTAFKTFLENIN